MDSSEILRGLNAQQAEAVSAGTGATLVIAGPGSGKTAVLTRRVAYLIREMGVPPYRIMAVTFTNKAAREMLERIERLLGEGMKGITIGTFHSICARILRREAQHIGLKSDYVIYDTDDQTSLMKQVIEEAQMDPEKTSPRRYLSLISGAKNELITPERYPTGSYEDRNAAKLYKRYQDLLRKSGALDFDDLLMQSVRLFQTVPDALERYHEYFQHILVDEFQDTNTAQYMLIKLLAGQENSLFCVGDPDQSIYRFRGADYRNIDRFRQDYPNARMILLEQNYRSHQVILDAAMAIIDKNQGRIRKQLTTTRRDGPKIILKNLRDEDDEAQYVAWTIREYVRSGRHNLRDVAVMYRTNAQSRALEETLGRVNIPYRLIGGVRFYSRKEVKDLLAYLRLIHNPDDSVSLRRIINVPARSIGKQTLTKLEEWALRRNEGLYTALRAIETEKNPPFTGRAAKALIDFGKMINAWHEAKETIPVGELLKDVIDQTAFTAYLDDGTPEGEERVQNVMEVYQRAAQAGSRTLAEFLEDVSLVADIDNYDETAESVVLLTLHSAKGLEFPIVFIIGLEEGLLPHQNAMSDDEQMAEERRLMYVGVTRAKEMLHLTWVTRRSYYGSMGERSLASRFLIDLPASHTTGSPIPVRENAAMRRSQITYPSATWKPQNQTPANPPLNRPPLRPFTEQRITAMYKPGQRVRHERWGDGVIIASKIRGDEEEIDVKFERIGIKRLFASITPLTMLEDED